MWCSVLGVLASAPAKIILFGEHFVVYGDPAVVLAIDKRAYAYAELRTDNRIHIYSKDLGISGFFIEGSFEPERGGQEAKIELAPLKTAVQKVLEIAERKVGVNVKVDSSIPVAAGLGSSAAVAAATSTAVSQLLNENLSREEISRIAYEVECLVHGTPSGIDPTISTYGGVLLFQKEKNLKTLKVKKDILLVVGDTGVKRSTGDLVAKVSKTREKYPSLVDFIIKAVKRFLCVQLNRYKKAIYPRSAS
jgi:mevalonate kinase